MPLPRCPRIVLKASTLVAVLFAGLGAGAATLNWRSRLLPSESSSSLPRSSQEVISVAPQLTERRRSFSVWPWRSRLDPVPPLVVPPPVVPQPQPPEAVWPEPPPLLSQRQFADVPPQAWINPILSDLAQRQLVSGFPDGSFRPEAPMTRAEFAAQINRLFVLNPRPVQQTYPDLATTHWASGSIQSAMAMGFLSGYPDRTFRPEASVTRLQVILALASGLSLKTSQPPDLVLRDYLDAHQVPAWAKAPVVAALEADVVVNYPDTRNLAPNRLASRAEVVAMLRQALVYTGQLSPLPPGYSPPPDQPAY